MLLFLINIIGVAYVVTMNGANIIERTKCIFYYENKVTPYSDRTHVTRICNFMMYFQSTFYATITDCYFHDFNSNENTEMIQIDFSNEGNSPSLTPYDNTISRYITITHCKFNNTGCYDGSKSTGVAGIGNHQNNPVRDVIISDCLFNNLHTCIRFRSIVGLHIRNLDIQNCGHAFVFNHNAVMDYSDRCRYITIMNCFMFLDAHATRTYLTFANDNNTDFKSDNIRIQDNSFQGSGGTYNQIDCTKATNFIFMNNYMINLNKNTAFPGRPPGEYFIRNNIIQGEFVDNLTFA